MSPRLAEVETRDNGKPPAHIRPGLKGGLAGFFDCYAGMADKFEDSVIPVNTPGIPNYQTWEPFDPVALITAWNSPLGVLLMKLAPALAAADVLPKGLISVVTGYGHTAAGDFSTSSTIGISSAITAWPRCRGTQCSGRSMMDRMRRPRRRGPGRNGCMAVSAAPVSVMPSLVSMRSA